MGGVGVGQRLGTYWKVFSCEDMGDCEWVQWMGGKGGVTKGRKMVRRSVKMRNRDQKRSVYHGGSSSGFARGGS